VLPPYGRAMIEVGVHEAKATLSRLETYVPERMRTTGVTPLPIAHRHTVEVAALPPIHGDPFDRVLVAQARVLDVPLVTADRRLQAKKVEALLVA
jgi:PIN domain nuclease of toxin-antitoxin system